MDITQTTKDSIAQLFLSGRFDYQEYRIFKTAYTAALDDPVITTVDVDFSGVGYIDSSALGMLLKLREEAHLRNKSVRLLYPNQAVRHIFETAFFRKLFEVVGAQ